MKKIIISTFVLLFNVVAFAQTTDNNPKEIASLQTDELVNYYHLSDDLKTKIFEINFLCANKIAALKADTQMSQEAVKEGIMYNDDLRDKSIRKLLSDKQLDSYIDFRYHSMYNKIEE